MTRNPKVSLATQVVLDARKKYPDILQSVAAHLGNPPYMKERLDPRARDKQLLMMTPDDMANLARTDPAQAEAAAQRITQIEARASANPLAPAQDQYEPE